MVVNEVFISCLGLFGGAGGLLLGVVVVWDVLGCSFGGLCFVAFGGLFFFSFVSPVLRSLYANRHTDRRTEDGHSNETMVHLFTIPASFSCPLAMAANKSY